MLTCLIPLAYLYVTVNYAGYWMVRNVYLNPEAGGYSVLNGVLSIIMLVLGAVIMVTAILKWRDLWSDPKGLKAQAVGKVEGKAEPAVLASSSQS